MEPNPPGFNPAEVVAGIHLAMDFGAPNQVDDQATFCWTTSTYTGAVDEDGVPFDPSARATTTTNSERRSCAIESSEVVEQSERYGIRTPTKITVTLLAPDYAGIEDFEYVVWGGDKYLRGKTDIYALGSLDVYIITCRAEDDR